MSDLSPAKWQQRSLASLGDYENGFAFNELHWSEHGLPIIRIAQITGSQGIVDRYPGKLSDTYRLDDGDLIFSWSGTLAVVRWSGGPAWLNQHLFKVVPTAGIDRSFLFHVLQASVAEMSKRTHGSTMKHIKRGELREFLVEIPINEDEQKKIAKILDTLDTAIRETEAILDKLKAVKQGLLHDLLTRGIDANGELRPPQSEAPQLYKKSPLGWIPKEWEKLSLGTCAEISSGVTLGRSLSGFGAIELPYLRVANVQDGYLDLREVKTVSILPAELSRFSLESGDVLMNEGGDFDKLGRGAVWEGQIEPCLHQNHVFRVRCDRTRLLPEYLAAYSGSARGKAYFVQASKQTTNLASINSTQLKVFEITCPEVVEQEAIIQRLSSLEDKSKAEQCRFEKLCSLKRSLMDDLLTGRVRVTPLLEGATSQ